VGRDYPALVTNYVTGLSIIGFLVIKAAKGIDPVAAFFFVFKRLEDCNYVSVVALALQRIENTRIFSVEDWQYRKNWYLTN
jgi:hypothetical protein